MITACNFIDPNGEPSKLGRYLEENYGEQALQKWGLLQSPHAAKIIAEHYEILLDPNSRELFPMAAEYLLNLVENPDQKFDKRIYLEIAGKDAIDIDVVTREKTSKVMKFFEPSRLEKPSAILRGRQTLTLRSKAIDGFQTVGESKVVHINGKPIRMTYQGFKNSEDRDASLQQLGLPPSADIEKVFNDIHYDAADNMAMTRMLEDWLDGNKGYHVYTFDKINSIQAIIDLFNDTTIDDFNPMKSIDEKALNETIRSILPVVLDENGKETGEFFSFELMNSSIEYINMYLNNTFKELVRSGSKLNVQMIVDALVKAKMGAYGELVRYKRIAAGNIRPNDPVHITNAPVEEIEKRIQNFTTLYNSFAELTPFVLDRLVRVGQSVNPNTAPRIQAILRRQAKDLRDNGATLEEDSDIAVQDENEVNQTENSDVQITEDTVKGVTDWSQQHIEMDPLLTAARNVKLFLATVNEHTFGKRTPKNKKVIQFDPNYISARKELIDNNQEFSGRGLITFTPEQVASIGSNVPFSFQMDDTWYTVSDVKEIPSFDADKNWRKINPTATHMANIRVHTGRIDEPTIVRNNELGTNSYADPVILFQNLLREAQKAKKPELSYIIQAFKQSSIPNVVKVGELMESGAVPEDLISSLKLAVDKQYLEHFIMETSFSEKGKSEVFDTYNYSANSSAEMTVITKSWQEKQKVSRIVKRENDKLDIDTKRVEFHNQRIKGILTELKNVKSIKGLPKARIEAQLEIESRATTIIDQFLKDSGIELSELSLKVLTNTNRTAEPVKFIYNKVLETLLSKNGTIGILLEGYLEGDPEVQRDDPFRANNPLYNKRHKIGELARLEMKYSGDPVFGITHKSSEGKVIFSFTNHTYQSRTIQALKDKDSELSKQMRKILPNSWFLNQFHAIDIPGNSDAQNRAAQENAKGKLMYLDSLRHDKEPKTRGDMSSREQLILGLNSFFARGGRYGTFIDMTKSDKSTSPVFSDMAKLSDAEAKAEVRKIVGLELARVRKWHTKREDINNAKFQSGGGFFYFLPAMNDYDALVALDERRVARGIPSELIHIQNMFPAVEEGKRTFNPSMNGMSFNKVVDLAFEEYIADEGQKILNLMYKEGIIDTRSAISDGAIISYIKNINKGLGDAHAIQYKLDKKSKELKFSVNGDNSITSDEVRESVIKYMLQNYVGNVFVLNTSVAMVMSGDPAFFYKGSKTDSVLDSIDSTLTEYQKRLAKDIAPGLDPNWDVDEKFTSITIADPNLKSELFGVFDSAADAQEVTTVAEHLYVAHKSGKIPLAIYNEMIEIINNAKDGYYEFTDPRHLEQVMQPMKPVYVNRRFMDGFMVVDYIKTSSFPLLPQMLKGTQLDALRRAMESQGIQRAVFNSGNKAGSPVKPLELFDKDGNIVEAALEKNNVADSLSTLTRGGFRIQQEVPYEPLKQAIHNVTQMDKLIVEGIDTITDFELRGENLTGDEVRKRKEDNRKRLYKLSFDEFIDSIGGFEILQDETESVTSHIVGRLKDPGKFYDKLVFEAIKMGYSKPDIDQLRNQINGELRMPLWFNGSADKLESLIMSMVRKIVTSKTPGKSFIQGSSLGIKYRTPEDLANSGIIFVDNPGNQFDPEKGLQFIRKDKDGKVIPAQIIVPFNFDDGKGNLLDISDFTYEKDGRIMIDPKSLPTELLQLVGARIPNQGFSSMLPMEIVGFLPHQMGDLALVPIEITQQMGSDFDVDKIYTYRRNYRYEPEDGIIYQPKDFQGTEEYDGGERSKEVTRIQDEYFDIHWSILNHGEIFDRVTQPLDKSDLVDEMKVARTISDRPVASKTTGREYTPESLEGIPSGQIFIHKGEMEADLVGESLADFFERANNNPGKKFYVPLQNLEVEDVKNQVHEIIDVNGDDFIGDNVILPKEYEVRPTLEVPAPQQTTSTKSNFFGPSRQLEDFAAQKDAKNLVAWSSLFSTFASDIQRYNLYIQEEHFVEGELVSRRKEIEVMDENGDVLKLSNLSGQGVSYYTKDGEEVKDEKSAIRSKVINNTIMQNEFLDYSKNRTIDSFNLNAVTYPVAATLMMLSTNEGTTNGAANAGRSLNLKFATRLLQQESIVRFVNEVSNEGDMFSTGFGNGERRVIESLRAEYREKAGLSGTDTHVKTIFSPQLLLETLQTPSDQIGKEYYLRQLDALELFLEVKEVADELKKVMGNYNTDTKGPGANVVKALDRIAKNQQILGDNRIAGMQKFLDTSQKGAAYKHTMNAIFGVLDGLFPHNKLIYTYNEIQNSFGSGVKLNEDTFRDLLNHTKAYIMSSPYIGLVNDVEKTLAYFLYDTDSSMSLAKRVESAKGSFKTGKALLDRLSPQIATDSGDPSLVYYRPIRNSTFELEDNYRAFMEMLLSKDKVEQELAQDLIKYTLLTDASGGNSSLMRFIPPSFYTINGVDTKLRSLMKKNDWSNLMWNFKTQYFQHNPDKLQTFPQEMRTAVVGGFVTKTKEGKKFLNLKVAPEFLRIDTSEVEGPINDIYSLKVKGAHYVYVRADSSVDGHVVFQKVDTLGRGYLREYNSSTRFKRSVIGGNRAEYPFNGTFSIFGHHLPSLQTEGWKLPSAYLRKNSEHIDEVFKGRTSIEMEEMYDHTQAPLTRLVMDLAGSITDSNVEFKLENLGTEIEGRATYSESGSGVIEINPALIRGKEDLDRLIAHEAVHIVTLKMVDDFKKDRDKAGDIYGSRAQAAYNKLDALRLEIRERISKMASTELLDGNGAFEEINRATENMDEFISGVLSSPQLQAYLNENQSTSDQTFFEKLSGLFKQLIEALAAQFNIDIKKGSELEAALNNITALLAASRKIDTDANIEQLMGLSAFSKKAAPKVPKAVRHGIEDLKTLRQELYNLQAITTDKLSPQYVSRAHQISDLNLSIRELISSPNYGALFVTADNQIKYAEAILERGGGDYNELQTAMVTSRTWVQIIDRTFENVEEKPEEIDAILSRAKTAEANLIRLFKELVIKSDGNIVDDVKDFEPENIEAGILHNMRALNQYKSKVAQDVARQVSGADRIRISEERRFIQQMTAVMDKAERIAKSRGITVEKLLGLIMKPKNFGWGLTDAFSEKYYIYLDDMTKGYEKGVMVGRKNKHVRHINTAKTKFLGKLTKHFLFLNISTVLDEETGEFLNTPEAKKELERYKSQFNDQMESADSVVEQIQRAYMDYLGMREAFKEQLDRQTQDRIANIELIHKTVLESLKDADKKKFIAEQKLMIAKEARNAYSRFVMQNSPYEFMNTIGNRVVAGTDPESIMPFQNWSALKLLPNPKDGLMFDENMTKIVNDPDLLMLHKFFRENFDRFTAMLPPNATEDLRPDFIPIVRKRDKPSNILTSTKSYLGRVVASSISHELDYVEYTETGKSRIPVRYTNENSVAPEERERNLFVVMEKYAKMALHFKHMAGVQSYAELMLHTIGESVSKGPAGADVKYKNQKVQKLYNAIEYHMDTLMYQKPKSIEFKAAKGSYIYGENFFDSKRLRKELELLEKEHQDLMAARVEEVSKELEDEATGEVKRASERKYKAALRRISKRMDDINAQRRVVNGTAITDGLIKYTQLRLLGWSPMSATANLTFGILTGISHASMGIDFNEAQYRKAIGIMFSATKRAVGIKNDQAEKIMNLIDRSGILGDIMQIDFAGESLVQSKRKGFWKSTIAPFQLLRQSDYFMKGLIVVAMAQNTEVVKDDGTKTTLWEAINTDGSIDGATKWYNEDVSKETEFARFQRRAIAVNTMIMGNQDPSSPLLARKTVLGRLLGQFKLSWMPELWALRMQDEVYVDDLERSVKGSYRTLWDQRQNLHRHFLTMVRGAFIKTSELQFKQATGEPISDMEMANMRRNASDIRFGILIYMMMQMLTYILNNMDDDDDEISVARTAMFVSQNILFRNYQDLTTFADPGFVSGLSSGVIPSANVFLQIDLAIEGTWKYITQDSDGRFTAKQMLYRWAKLFPGTNLIPSIENTATKLGREYNR